MLIDPIQLLDLVLEVVGVGALPWKVLLVEDVREEEDAASLQFVSFEHTTREDHFQNSILGIHKQLVELICPH